MNLTITTQPKKKKSKELVLKSSCKWFCFLGRKRLQNDNSLLCKVAKGATQKWRQTGPNWTLLCRNDQPMVQHTIGGNSSNLVAHQSDTYWQTLELNTEDKQTKTSCITLNCIFIKWLFLRIEIEKVFKLFYTFIVSYIVQCVQT